MVIVILRFRTRLGHQSGGLSLHCCGALSNYLSWWAQHTLSSYVPVHGLKNVALLSHSLPLCKIISAKCVCAQLYRVQQGFDVVDLIAL